MKSNAKHNELKTQMTSDNKAISIDNKADMRKMMQDLVNSIANNDEDNSHHQIMKIFNVHENIVSHIYKNIRRLIFSMDLLVELGLMVNQFNQHTFDHMTQPIIECIQNLATVIDDENLKKMLFNTLFHKRTVLHDAVLTRNVSMVKFLLKQGMHPLAIADSKNHTVFALFAKMGGGLYSYAENNKCIKLLLESALKNTRDQNSGVLIYAIIEALTPQKNFYNTTFEFSNVLAQFIQEKIFPLSYFARIIPQININDFPALKPAVQALKQEMANEVKNATKVAPPLASIIADYALDDNKQAEPNAENAALLNHAINVTINLLAREENNKHFEHTHRGHNLKDLMDSLTVLQTRVKDKTLSQKSQGKSQEERYRSIASEFNHILQNVKNVMGANEAKSILAKLFTSDTKPQANWKAFIKDNHRVLAAVENMHQLDAELLFKSRSLER